MDKKLFKAYVRTLVEEEMQRLLPKMLAEAVVEIKKTAPKQIAEVAPPTQQKKSPIDRARLAELMGIDYDRERGVISANTTHMPTTVTTIDAAGNEIAISADRVPKEVLDAVTRDYSDLMKALKL
jgi:hypothetical protein